MVFHSLQFVAFLIVVVAAYFATPARWRWAVLLASSLYFYGVAGPTFLLQILAATAVSYWLAQRIEAAPDKPAKKRLVTVGILLLVANLVAFKYTSFFNETLRSVFDWMGVEYSAPVVHIIMPIGISFYTFQLISYLVDVFRGAKAEVNVGRFALFVTFFPKMVAGPIERAKSLLPQLHQEHRFDYQLVVSGLQLMLWGAFKKIVVADRIAPFVQQVYDNPQSHDGVMMTLATWLYAFQIYCDFSGYTDMALGIALIFGIRLTDNFNRPYFAVSIQDFWKRWHISLTSWLTDYIYTPLTRQRMVKMKFYTLMLVGLFVTFVVSGFWHGAQWTFVAWGALHGLYIVTSLQTQKARASVVKAIGLNKRPRLHHALKVIVTFNLVSLAYILFRANTMQDAIYIATHLFTGWGDALGTVKDFVRDNIAELGLACAGILIVMGAEAVKGQGDRIGTAMAARPVLRWGAYYVGCTAILVLGAFYGLDQKFIYFRF